MEKINVFITGVTGFIGKNILEQLGDVYTFLAPTHEQLDLEDEQAVYNFLSQHPVDVVLHAANRGGNRNDQNVTQVTLKNLKIFFNIVRAKPFFKRMIVLGSGAEYDKRRSLVHVAEAEFNKVVPADEYGFYKYVCARYAEQVDYITHVRLFGVFGKYEDYTVRFISNIICMALFGLPITIKQNVCFDYLYINDLVHIIHQLIQQKPTETFINVGSGTPMETRAIAELVTRHFSPPPAVVVEQPGLNREYTCDTTRLKTLFPNFSFTPLETAISELITYYRQQLPTLCKEQFLHVI